MWIKLHLYVSFFCVFRFYSFISFFLFFFFGACFSIWSPISLKSNDIYDKNCDFVAKNVSRSRDIGRMRYVRRRCNLMNLNL